MTGLQGGRAYPGRDGVADRAGLPNRADGFDKNSKIFTVLLYI
ncbi:MULTISPECIES: hypothetical protein [unclassified Rhodanobacter]|nr:MULTISPECIES: hypothetical protein [unclassified Rhodanobacter]